MGRRSAEKQPRKSGTRASLCFLNDCRHALKGKIRYENAGIYQYHALPAHIYWRSEGGACCSRGGEYPTETCMYLVRGPGSRHGLGSQPGIWSPRIPAMASSQGDVRPSFPDGMHTSQRSVRPLPKLPLPLRGQARALPLSSSYRSSTIRFRPERHRAQSASPATSPSGHPPVCLSVSVLRP